MVLCFHELNSGTLEPWNPGTLEPWNPGTLETRVALLQKKAGLRSGAF